MIPAWSVLWLIGVALVAVGYRRARGPWSRYQELREQQANVARYEAWRGGLRTTEDGPTGASVAMAQLRRQAQAAGLIAIVGFVLIFVGFLLR
jgi:uncharacterized membrane protein